LFFYCIYCVISVLHLPLFYLGQNKNQYMMGYLLWRVQRGLHCDVEIKMQVPGHTRYVLSWNAVHNDNHYMWDKTHLSNTSKVWFLLLRPIYNFLMLYWWRIRSHQEAVPADRRWDVDAIGRCSRQIKLDKQKRPIQQSHGRPNMGVVCPSHIFNTE